MNQAWFLTGTDTEIGKTFVACALLYAARREGWSAAGMKPVAAGRDGEGRNEDVEQLLAAASAPLPRAAIAPFIFKAAIAPHLAAREERRPIRFSPILDACQRLRATFDRVVVEGVGGFCVPLGDEGDDGDSADLAVALNLPVILVVGLRLGCLNHALLTAEAIARRGLPLAGWVANGIDPAMARPQDNVDTLRRLLPAPCLGVIPHQPAPDARQAAAFLRLPGEDESAASSAIP